VDTFDPKPLLAKHDGKVVDEVVKDYAKQAFKLTGGLDGGNRLGGKLKSPPFAFQKHGQCGMEISELFPKLATHADELCVVRSMRSNGSVHGPAANFMTPGTRSTCARVSAPGRSTVWARKTRTCPPL
jgi:hypothetical protein